MLNPQTIRVVYISGKKNGTLNSSNIWSKSHIKPMSIIIVKRPSVIISNGRDRAFKSGFKK